MTPEEFSKDLQEFMNICYGPKNDSDSVFLKSAERERLEVLGKNLIPYLEEQVEKIKNGGKPDPIQFEGKTSTLEDMIFPLQKTFFMNYSKLSSFANRFIEGHDPRLVDMTNNLNTQLENLSNELAIKKRYEYTDYDTKRMDQYLNGLNKEFGLEGSSEKFSFDPETKTIKAPDSHYQLLLAKGCALKEGMREVGKPVTLTITVETNTFLNSIAAEEEILRQQIRELQKRAEAKRCFVFSPSKEDKKINNEIIKMKGYKSLTELKFDELTAIKQKILDSRERAPYSKELTKNIDKIFKSEIKPKEKTSVTETPETPRKLR